MPIIQSLTTPNNISVWIIHTQNTDYALTLDQGGRLRQIYWGASLPLVGDYGSPEEWKRQSSFDAFSREEFPGWGEYKFTEPCLKVKFHDGVRAILLNYESAQIEEQDGIGKLVIALRDPHYPLKVQLIYRALADCDVIERSVSVQNLGSDPVEIEQINSAAWHFPRRDSYQLTTLNGKWGGEFQIQTIDLPMGKQVVERRRGASGFDSNPWFALGSDHETTETHGEVWFGALAFGGNYRLTIERTAFEIVSVTGGINNFDFLWRLEGGESFETPVFVAGYTQRGYGEASRLLHGYAINHVLPPSTARKVRPTLYNSWYVTEFSVNVENQSKAAEKAAQLGLEVFVMDDGWFGQRKDDHAGLGDWYVNREKFPDGLGPLIRRVNELGMDFGIWVEPEMVNPDSDLYHQHPDWVYHFPNRPRSEGRNQLVLNVSRPDVQAFILDFMEDLLSQNNIKFIKWDMNRHFSEPGWPDAPTGRDREIWVRHTRGLYEIFRTLRERHPDVLFESCSGGGGRVDLGIMAYAEQFWMSDNTDAFDDLRIQEGFTMAYPPLTRMLWVTEPIGINNHRALSLEYRFHVAMCGALGVGADLNRWSEADMDTARRLIGLYKEVRETIQLGQLYRLRSPRTSDLSAVQFVRPDGHESVVFIFLHASHFGEHQGLLRLQGLEPDTRYRVDESEVLYSGTALMERGLDIHMRGTFTSQMIRIRLA